MFVFVNFIAKIYARTEILQSFLAKLDSDKSNFLKNTVHCSFEVNPEYQTGEVRYLITY